MNMYILIKESVPLGHAMCAAAHASLACFRKFEATPEMQDWINGVFYKKLCKVTEKEFELAKEEPGHIVLTESALDGQEVVIAFKPREEYPKRFKFFKLYR